jgi:hypothetical protein
MFNGTSTGFNPAVLLAVVVGNEISTNKALFAAVALVLAVGHAEVPRTQIVTHVG